MTSATLRRLLREMEAERKLLNECSTYMAWRDCRFCIVRHRNLDLCASPEVRYEPANECAEPAFCVSSYTRHLGVWKESA